jgi:hypothetical protein
MPGRRTKVGVCKCITKGCINNDVLHPDTRIPTKGLVLDVETIRRHRDLDRQAGRSGAPVKAAEAVEDAILFKTVFPADMTNETEVEDASDQNATENQTDELADILRDTLTVDQLQTLNSDERIRSRLILYAEGLNRRRTALSQVTEVVFTRPPDNAADSNPVLRRESARNRAIISTTGWLDVIQENIKAIKTDSDEINQLITSMLDRLKATKEMIDSIIERHWFQEKVTLGLIPFDLGQGIEPVVPCSKFMIDL